MGRYLTRLYRLLAMPADGLPVGTLRPADSPVLVRELARLRLSELKAATGIADLPPVAQNAIRQHFFHTWEDFLLKEKQGRPGRSDPIGYGRSLDHDTEDSAGYLKHITERDPTFGRFLHTEAEARIGREAFDTSVYITGETQSGKSYLSQLLAWLLAGREKSSVWILVLTGRSPAPAANGRRSKASRAAFISTSIWQLAWTDMIPAARN